MQVLPTNLREIQHVFFFAAFILSISKLGHSVGSSLSQDVRLWEQNGCRPIVAGLSSGDVSNRDTKPAF